MIRYKMFWRLSGASCLAVAIGLFPNCGRKAPIVPQATDQFSARIEIHPPSFARSDSALWNDEIIVEIPIDLPGEEGGNHKVSFGRASVVDTTIHGITIEIEVEDAEFMRMWMDGSWMDHHPVTDEHHVVIRLEDANLDAHASKICYCDVGIVVESNGVVVDSGTLQPMYGEHGLHFGSNFSLPDSGNYQITVTAGVPTFVRGETTSDRWMQATEVMFNYTYSGTPLEDEIEIGEAWGQDSMIVELEAGGPERMWVFMGGSWMWMDPGPNDTHHFEVKLEDPSIETHHEMIGYCEIHMTIINETTGSESSEIELYPMYDDHGFHYGVNMLFPNGEGDDGGHDGH